MVAGYEDDALLASFIKKKSEKQSNHKYNRKHSPRRIKHHSKKELMHFTPPFVYGLYLPSLRCNLLSQTAEASACIAPDYTAVLQEHVGQPFGS